MSRSQLFDFANDDLEIRWQSHSALIEHWLGPAEFERVVIDPETPIPLHVKLYHELASQWSPDKFGDFHYLCPIDSFADSDREDGLVAFAGDNHAGFRYVTEPGDQDGNVWIVEWDEAVDEQTRLQSDSLVDELARLTIDRFLMGGQGDECHFSIRALQPKVASGELSVEWIDFGSRSPGPHRRFAVIEGNLLLGDVDINGRALFGRAIAQAGASEQWEQRVSGQLSGVKITMSPTSYDNFRGERVTSRWTLDINPDGSGHIQHGESARDTVRQWFAAGTIDVDAIRSQLRRSHDDSNVVSVLYGGDDQYGSLARLDAEKVFSTIVDSFESVTPEVAQRLAK